MKDSAAKALIVATDAIAEKTKALFADVQIISLDAATKTGEKVHSFAKLAETTEKVATITAGTAVAFDNRALEVRERSPIRLESVDIARGGVDLGFYSYGGVNFFDSRLILKVALDD